jgi:hypothetical protein
VLLDPCIGNCTWEFEFKSSKASLAEHMTFAAGFHLMMSVSLEGTV